MDANADEGCGPAADASAVSSRRIPMEASLQTITSPFRNPPRTILPLAGINGSLLFLRREWITEIVRDRQKKAGRPMRLTPGKLRGLKAVSSRQGIIAALAM